MLPEVVGASVFRERVVAPLRQVIGLRRGRGRFVMGRVTGVDVERRLLACETLAGEQHFACDHLVLAIGNRARLDLIPGMAEHAVPLKTVGDALHIRNLVLRRLAWIELETDPARRRRLGHFIVIGGSFSGVEITGALADGLRGNARYYLRVEFGGFCQGSRQMPVWPAEAALVGPGTSGAGAGDGLRALRLRGGHRAAGAHGPGLPLVPLPRLRQTSRCEGAAAISIAPSTAPLRWST
jgi:pyridine nucleotide-disulfide oxidoreductase